MSLVICVATTNNIIIAGDTQINNADGPLQDTAMKVFPIGKDTLVGITGDYKTYIEAANKRIIELDAENASFEEKVSFIKNMIYEKENNAVIAGFDRGKVKLQVMGYEYGYNDSIIEVNNGAEIKVLLPPGITTEMCKPYITSLNNLKGQVVTCIKQISRNSDTVNDKVCGLETDGVNLEVFTSGIEYKDINVRIQ